MKKFVIFMRHGKYEFRGDEGLTPEGVVQAQVAARQIFDKGFTPELIVTSPSWRARQTAETSRNEFLALSAAFPKAMPFHFCERDAFDEFPDVQVAAGFIKSSLRTFNSVLVVSHAPTIKQVAKELTGKTFDEQDYASCRVMSTCNANNLAPQFVTEAFVHVDRRMVEAKLQEKGQTPGVA